VAPPVQESRAPQRLYAPSRSSLRPDGAPVPSAPAAKEPWTADHPWRPAGQDADYSLGNDAALHGLRGRFITIGLIAAANAGFASSIPLVRDLTAFLDVFGIVLLFDTLLRIWQSGRRTRMRWTTFPAFVGGRLEAVLTARSSLEPVGEVRAVLRCVRDEPQVRGGETFLEPMVIYQQISELPIAEERLKELRLSFDIPADLPGTDLGRDDAVYWQVALRIPVVGPDVEIVFLAPVYARPS
jgi:hypothetical protein